MPRVAMRSTLVWKNSSGLPSLNCLAISRPCCWLQPVAQSAKTAASSSGHREVKTVDVRSIGTGSDLWATRRSRVAGTGVDQQNAKKCSGAGRISLGLQQRGERDHATRAIKRPAEKARYIALCRSELAREKLTGAACNQEARVIVDVFREQARSYNSITAQGRARLPERLQVSGCSLATESAASTSDMSSSSGASSSGGSGTFSSSRRGSCPVSLSVPRVTACWEMLPGAFSLISMLALSVYRSGYPCLRLRGNKGWRVPDVRRMVVRLF